MDGKELKNKRLEFKLTQRQLAENTGVNVFTIQNIEQNTRRGSIETWNKINNFFNNYNEIKTNNQTVEKWMNKKEIAEKLTQVGFKVQYENYQYWNNVPYIEILDFKLILANDYYCRGSQSLNSEYTEEQIDKVIEFIEMLKDNEIYQKNNKCEIYQEDFLSENDKIMELKLIINKSAIINITEILDLDFNKIYIEDTSSSVEELERKYDCMVF